MPIREGFMVDVLYAHLCLVDKAVVDLNLRITRLMAAELPPLDPSIVAKMDEVFAQKKREDEDKLRATFFENAPPPKEETFERTLFLAGRICERLRVHDVTVPLISVADVIEEESRSQKDLAARLRLAAPATKRLTDHDRRTPVRRCDGVERYAYPQELIFFDVTDPHAYETLQRFFAAVDRLAAAQGMDPVVYAQHLRSVGEILHELYTRAECEALLDQYLSPYLDAEKLQRDSLVATMARCLPQGTLECLAPQIRDLALAWRAQQLTGIYAN